MKLKKAIAILLVFSMLGTFGCCFSAAAEKTVIGKAYISFSDNGVRRGTTCAVREDMLQELRKLLGETCVVLK